MLGNLPSKKVAPLSRNTGHFRRSWRLFPSARSAFRAFLKSIEFQPVQEVLLPAYIGWSAKEGSGVYDPVEELGLQSRFYRVDSQLQIDLAHLEQCFKEGKSKVFVIIHYFGYVDPGYSDAIAMARRYGCWVLEDEAHALFTDLVEGTSGRLGDACIFSLHKMLPFSGGGMLILNEGNGDILGENKSLVGEFPVPWDYDLKLIAQRRHQNAERLTELLSPLQNEVVPLWEDPKVSGVPQTYPVIIKNVSRDSLYLSLNNVGIGVVSLYHTLIKQITVAEFPASYRLSRTIMNLPLHQDLEPEMLKTMVDQIGKSIAELKRQS